MSDAARAAAAAAAAAAAGNAGGAAGGPPPPPPPGGANAARDNNVAPPPPANNDAARIVPQIAFGDAVPPPAPQDPVLSQHQRRRIPQQHGALHNAELSLATPCLCYGATSTNDKDARTPKEFMRQFKQKINRSNWSDATAIESIRQACREEALAFIQNTEFQFQEGDPASPLASLPTFWKAWEEHYGITSTFITPDWFKEWTQKPKEPFQAFIARAQNATYSHINKLEGLVADHDKANRIFTREYQLAVTSALYNMTLDLGAGQEPLQQNLVRAISERLNNFLAAHTRRAYTEFIFETRKDFVNNLVVKELAFKHMSSSEQRRMAEEGLERGDDVQTIISRLTRHDPNRAKFPTSVAAVTTDPEAQAEVAAAAAPKPKTNSNTKRKDNKPANANSNGNKQKQCKYCTKRGHTVSECKTKKAAAKLQAKVNEVTDDATPPTVDAAGADAISTHSGNAW